ncbi:hypothetical protein ACU635_60095 [[Actinomadura] parvosata]|uniref:hypothetical protein n=1 Tax=[Actinomadura] parvosata TaxID=1955412 RepID=UPI00406C7186
MVTQLQKFVDVSGLGADEQFVVALLNAVSAPDFPLTATMRKIRKALAEAAEIRELGGWWQEKLDAYVASISDEPFEIATFLQECMSGGLSLDHKDAVAGQTLLLPTPLLLVRQPVFEERANVAGLLGGYRYQTGVIEIGMGTHAVVEVAPNSFHKFFTCEWAFTVDYDATDPGAARASYQVTGQRFESGAIALSGRKPLTGDYLDQIRPRYLGLDVRHCRPHPHGRQHRRPS